ncbi:hypothetical protein FB451DRAFT_1403893 [Mycena latifolia]|nr:hypothetical protein FB451DRAFT_1403893 [Mycena latifolia]
MPKSRKLRRSCKPKPPYGEKARRIVEITAARAAAVNANHHDHPAMAIYLAASAAFEADFGHTLASDDGWDEHFKQMAFHARIAKALASSCNNDDEKIALVAAQPLTFDVKNPYAAGDPRRTQFDAKMRGYARALAPTADCDGSDIHFKIENCSAKCPEMRLRQHCRCEYVKYLMLTAD